ncbi:hypothetical protein PSEUBRA_000810 [Kalmanozyma brasiliensis GHG001]|uniref:Transmembrane protein n=1 Tax=Kalmanozyma brasiliensis (strain GHG001) TaxID=1365824 RepID=V5EGD2_KALBG|nr:uncharacterized protein PSEUBRA_000810 [Kalmanozyma brasiliensis GHG001]EST09591.1 hypothetical protein PSEUBRA_000810 [Kalmanozyma brasiliensis GHG001]
MRASSSTLVVALTTLLTTLSALSTLVAANHIPFGDASLVARSNAQHSSQLVARDASTLTAAQQGTPLGHEDHSDPVAPSGARLRSLSVGAHSLAAYWTRSPSNTLARQAFIMIHGRNRDGDAYWTTMHDILTSAVSAGYTAADSNAIIVAPEFYSARLNNGQYSSDELAWGDINAWQAGEAAVHPRGATETSFDALDALAEHFSNQTQYPRLEELVFVGHGGGGQLMNRYAIVAKTPSSNLAVRYIAGDPSSSVYFTSDRPTTDRSVATKEDCPLWNTWRYGFDNFTTPLTPRQHFNNVISRDVRYVVGYDDTASSGDQYCMALLQGGVARRDRNLAWWKYINYLARTNEDVRGFPGNLTKEALPDWTGTLRHTMTVIRGATHNADEVFGSSEGRTVLFEKSASDVAVGWRPSGWRKAVATSETTSASAVSATGGAAASGSSSTSTSGAQSVQRNWTALATLLSLATAIAAWI